jgi:hypothetical protein
MTQRTPEEQRKIDIGKGINKKILVRGWELNQQKSGQQKPAQTQQKQKTFV